MNSDARLSRSRLLLGDKTMERLEAVRVIIFGMGGVGSWAAEALARSGLRHLTIVDNDCVSESNINRQLPATIETIGRMKVDVVREHIAKINPDAEITALSMAYTPETASSFNLDGFDYVIDAIDSLSNKVALILHATSVRRVKFYSSMGAARKLDPQKIEVAEFYDVKGCPLARAIRQRLKRQNQRPARKFKCVYSPELIDNRGENQASDSSGAWDAVKGSANGSILHITGIFGFTLAGLVINDLCER